MFCPLKFNVGWKVLEAAPDKALCETQDCNWWNPKVARCAILSTTPNMERVTELLATIADHLQEISQATILGSR